MCWAHTELLTSTEPALISWCIFSYPSINLEQQSCWTKLEVWSLLQIGKRMLKAATYSKSRTADCQHVSHRCSHAPSLAAHIGSMTRASNVWGMLNLHPSDTLLPLPSPTLCPGYRDQGLPQDVWWRMLSSAEVSCSFCQLNDPEIPAATFGMTRHCQCLDVGQWADTRRN